MSAGASNGNGPFGRPRSRTLRRDRKQARIAGVCAGIANYLGMEAWVVRCAAATCLIFMPNITFPAYWILFFAIGKPQEDEGEDRPQDARGRADHSAPAPELGMRLSPRRSLRHLQADLMQAELRLRRIEYHITSGRYELQKELHKLDPGPGH